MSIARWKDLCVDAVDAHRLGVFWAAALGLTGEEDPDDPDYALAGPTPEHRVWINTVPEPVTVKQRIHLDVIGYSVEEFTDRGAVAVSRPGEFSWTVLRDPEGGELCVFVRDQVPDQRLQALGVDCANSEPIARWWAGVFGADLVEEPNQYFWIENIPGAPFDSMDFVPVPEPKTVKNRIHWDVVGSVADLQAAGATVLRRPDGDIRWTVMADPDGNEFCAFD